MKKLGLLLVLFAVAGASFLIWRSSVPSLPSRIAKTLSGATASNTTAKPNNLLSTAENTGVEHGVIETSIPTDPPSKTRPSRPWESSFLSSLYSLSPGAALQFQLVGNQVAKGTIRHVERHDGEVIYISGEVVEPEPGRFFFQKQTEAGKAGAYAGVIELPGSKLAYRVEPASNEGASELVEMPLEEAICMALPPPENQQEEEIPPLDPSDFPDYLIPEYQEGIVPLQSLPGAAAVLYIDYRGGYTPTWGGITYARPNVSNAQIRDVWKRVAEDYMAFKVNVTTDLKVYQSAPESSRQRCVVTPTTTAAPGAGGVAYLNSWNWTGDTPCWAFYTTGKSAAEVIAHEVGHTLTLSHDGQNPSTGYYDGHGSGTTGWAPIMGVGYYQNVSQWSRGEYANANNTEDDLSRITTRNNNVIYRADDTGPVLATSRHLEVYPAGTTSAEGVIERTGDTDAFQFTTGGGLVSLKAETAGTWANLALEATLVNSANTVIASNNPQSTLNAAIALSVPAGTYTLRVRGAGRSDPLTTGFSSYASLGYYSITGTVANARQPDRFEVAENSPVGTLLGVIAPATNSDLRVYAIQSGNTGNAFLVNYLGQLRVATASVLNYETLAANTQLPVQYELLVNITNLTNPNLTELNRRVVVAVRDVNEVPTVLGSSISVLSGTELGATIGKVTASDVDFYDLISFSIAAGDPTGRFAIHPQTGEITVRGALDSTIQNRYSLQIRVTDSGSPSPLIATAVVTVTILPNNSPYAPGSINCAVYTNIPGNLVSALTSAASFPSNPAYQITRSSFESETDLADNYGAVMRGYLIPPTTGNYTFWIASDDNSDLWLSTDSNPATMTRIAYVSGDGSWTSSRQWTKYATQQSAAQALVAGRAYYIEARHKEGSGGDNLAVGWTGPGIGTTTVIPGVYLAPYDMNYAPVATGFSGAVRRDLMEWARVGQVTVADVNTNQFWTYSIVSGNAEGIFAIDQEGWIRLANTLALQNTATPNFSLQVRVVDNGAPIRFATAWVTLTITDSNEITAESLQQEVFNDIGSGTAVANLTSNAKYPGRPDQLTVMSDFRTAVDVADNYGSRVRGYLIPPESGNYQFYVASDDASQLKLSSDDNPAHAVVIASVTGWTSQDQWTKEANQRSSLRSLVGGQRYYIEALQKEGSGGDHLSVAWTGPGYTDITVIPKTYLAPADINQAPQIPSQTLRVFTSAPNGTAIGRVGANDSPLDTLTYRIAGGNTGDTFTIDPTTGQIRIADNTLITSGAASSFSLTVQVQDSGYGGVYPLRTGQGSVSVLTQGANVPLVWTGDGSTNTWSDPTNWAGVAPANGARLIFGEPVNQATLHDTPAVVMWVQLTNSGFSIAGNPVMLQTGLTNSGDNVWKIETRLAAPQFWHSASGTFSVEGTTTNNGFNLGVVANSDFRIAGSIAGGGGLNKTGSSRLILEGAHFHTGPTIVGPASGTTSSLEVGGTMDLDLGNSDLTMNGRMDLWRHSARVGALFGTGTIFANHGNRILTVGANNRSGIFSGTMQDSSWAIGATLGLTKVGTGTQALAGANTFTGPIKVSSGTLIAAHANALGGASGGTTVLPGATLALSNNITIATEPLTLAGTGANELGALCNLVGLNTWNGRIQLSSPAKIRALSGRLTTSGAWETSNHEVAFDVGSGASVVINASLNGAGGITKQGAGVLSLNTANEFSGPLHVTGGIVTLGPAGRLARASLITVEASAGLNGESVGGLTLGAGQTVQGPGTLYGSFTLLGVLRPGMSIGSIGVSGHLFLQGATQIELAKENGAITNDMILCSGTLGLGGTLVVTNVGHEPLAAGDEFKILQAGSFTGGNFASTDLPALPPQLAWDLSSLAVDGTLRVLIAEPAAPPEIAVSTTSGTIAISWPTNYTSYILTGQTNETGEGLGSNWYPVTGVTNNQVLLPIDSTHSSVFYRLIQQ